MMTSNIENNIENENSVVTKRDLVKMFIRSLPLEISWDYARQDHIGFAYSLSPVLKKLYKTKDERKDALQRHLEFFNITPYFVTLVLGIVTAMEEKKAVNPDFDSNSINNIKASLMGTLSGIGDSLFLGTWRVITAGIGASLAIQGNPLGPILFLLLFNVPALAVRYICMMQGYRLGTKILDSISKSNLMEKISKFTGIVGLMTIGSMIATMVTVSTPIKFGSVDSPTEIQNILDSIMPCLLPAVFTYVIYRLLGKHMNTTVVLLLIVLFSIICSALGIL